MVEMGSKIISIREDIYNRLARLKGPNDSFSDVIEHLIIECHKDPLAHFGIGRDVPEDEAKAFEQAIKDARKEAKDAAARRFHETWEAPQ
jgi:predicted CopG family antitoxin